MHKSNKIMMKEPKLSPFIRKERKVQAKKKNNFCLAFMEQQRQWAQWATMTQILIATKRSSIEAPYF